MTTSIDASTLHDWLADGHEIALLDVREHGQYGEGHPFLAVPAPYSRLEAAIGALVPRLGVRTVVLDDGDGVAERAATRLRGLGYRDVRVLAGGAPAWAAAGHALFKGVNVPSKTFGELVEHARRTPAIGAAELQRRLQAGEPLVLVDGRTLAEHRKMTIPGAIPIPNGELAARIPGVLPDAQTPVVVHCAGRTRSIVGAQTLIDLGLPNPVFALENGTQGWRLAGLPLEHGSARELPPRAADAPLREAARALALRCGAPALCAAQAQAWLDDAARTTFVLDVRTAAEYAAGSLPGALHAPGGQLVQATDQFIGVRRARVLLLDDDGPQGLRAAVAASWLRRLGWEAATVEHGIRAGLRLPAPPPWLPSSAVPAVPGLGAPDLARRIGSGHAVLDLRPGMAHREGHPAGAAWAIRPRLAQALPSGAAGAATLVADDEAIARLAAIDLRELGVRDIAWTRWAAWREAGLPQASTPDDPSDAQAIDYLFFVHDRHDGNLDAARRYLAWETGLIAQCAPQELAVFDPAAG